MENRKRIIIAVLLMLSIGNFIRIQGTENIRVIEFLSIFTIGFLSALLFREIVMMLKK